MRWQITIDDIRYIKNRQWTVTYYLLLLFAAIIGFYEVITPEKAWDRVEDKKSTACSWLDIYGLAYWIEPKSA